MAETHITLDGDQKAFVVQALARFDTPTQVAEKVKEEFGLDVSRQLVHAYDPTKYAGRNLSEDLRRLFEDTRAHFLKAVDEIPIANKAMRLDSLNRMAARAEKQGNLGLAARLHEQAAKEMGGQFTNRVDHTSSDGSMSPRGLNDFYADKAKEGGE